MPDSVAPTTARSAAPSAAPSAAGLVPVSGRTVDRTVLAPDTASARAARTRVRALLTAAGIDDGALEAAVLIASELVTNAVRHGSGDVVLTVGTGSGEVSIGVHDDDPGRPSVVAPYEGGGRGMLVINSIASRWDVVADPVSPAGPVGKTVWAHIGLRGR